MKRWAFVAAALIPCTLLLVLCGIGLHEWWLISTNQIVVTPRPTPGAGSVPQVPAQRLLPLIVGSGLLAAWFGYAGWRGSKAALASGYLALALLALAPLIRRLL